MDEIMVFYFFQGEPGESFDLPNAFIMKIDKSKSRAITVNDLIQSFPVNSLPAVNTLHFRFKIEDDECGYVWLDIKNGTNEKIPLYSGCIITKIIINNNSNTISQKKKMILKLKSSLSSSSLQSKFTNYLNSINNTSSPSSQSRTASTAKNPNNSNNGNANDRNATSSPSHQQPRQPPTGGVNPRGTSQQQQQQSVFEADLISATVTAASAAPTSGTSVAGRRTVDNTIFPSSNNSNASLSTTASVEADMDMYHFDDNNGMNGTNANTAQSKSNSVLNHPNDDNLMAFDSPPAASSTRATSAASTTVGGAGAQLSRAELKEIREQGIEDKVKKALENKQEVDDVGRKESEEFDAAREKHDKALIAWSTNNKEKKNIRSLLSTMHTVLWSGCTNWKPIGLGDVIDSKQVKLQYRKAMLVVHPDRCSGPNISGEVKFIAKRIFEAINEAYQEFLKKETV